MFSSFNLDRFRTWIHPLIASFQQSGISDRQSLSLVPRPHPAHTRRRGLVSPVQIFGLALALAAWSDQWNRRVALIRIMQKQEQVLQSYYSHWPICNPTLTITRLQYFRKPKDSGLWHQTPSPRMNWVGCWHETTTTHLDCKLPAVPEAIIMCK